MVEQSSDEFLFVIGSVRALIGAVKVLGKLVDMRVFEAESIQDLLMRLKLEAAECGGRQVTSDDGQNSVECQVAFPSTPDPRPLFRVSGVGFQAGVGVRMHEHLSEQQSTDKPPIGLRSNRQAQRLALSFDQIS